jgi:hypothetical protein
VFTSPGKVDQLGRDGARGIPSGYTGNVTELGVFFPQIRRPVASTQEALIMTLGIRATIARIPGVEGLPGVPGTDD